jgi:transcriptional regulator with XRE-family HTH domain
MGFKDRLREARTARGLSGEALGTKLAVSKATISHWENGRYEPSIEQMKALCDELRVSADWLLERAEGNFSAEALQEAQAFEALSAEDRRKWRAMRRTIFATAV